MPESSQSTRGNNHRSRGNFALGIVLLVGGGVLLASNLGFVIPLQWWQFWPWLLISLGAARLLWPGSLHERLGGYWLVVVGVWGLINHYQLFGLRLHTSWPIFIIAVGLRIILGGVVRRFAADEPQT